MKLLFVCFLVVLPSGLSQNNILTNLLTALTRPNENDVRFFLWTNAYQRNPIELFTGQRETLANSPFSTFRPVKVLIHGFLENGLRSEFSVILRQAYLHRQNVNVITVDWKKLASGPVYAKAAQNTNQVGVLVARFIDFLVAQGTPTSAFHVIGFSLGAHVAGSAGNSLRSGRLPRITGLDPAGPDFEFPAKFRSLSTADANFVDVIHTNGIPIVGLGFTRPLGHVDFFPNGGGWQPGCTLPTESILPLRWCPHSRAYLYFAESIVAYPDVNPLFVATKCSSFKNFATGRCGYCETSQLNTTGCALMGEDTPATIRGTYYLSTNPVPPYANTRNNY